MSEPSNNINILACANYHWGGKSNYIKTNGKFIATIHIKTISNLYFIVCIERYFPGVVPVLSLKR